ncbi:hypothetical protein BJY28_000179 [Janibacter alkaliphilus]|uniref:Uncharacterized protein n=1 Tax=Janibacter alkaliphilus TaxID=1069963 RepID=A0A852X351_9MICO|nr:hypothetical protein [Janibacter alkaliphilus]
MTSMVGSGVRTAAGRRGAQLVPVFHAGGVLT